MGLYAIAFAFLALNDRAFWDDWVAYRHSLADTVQWFRELGFPFRWPGYFFGTQMSLDSGPWIARLGSFALYLGAAIQLRRALAHFPTIDPGTRDLISAVFAVFPVNFGRVIAVSEHYSLCYFAFFLAARITIGELVRPSLGKRAIAAALFLFSYSTNSLVMFAAVVPLAGLALGASQGLGPRASFVRVAKRAELLTLPFLFWAARSAWFMPEGRYATGYNELTSAGLVAGLARTWVGFFHAFLKPFLREWYLCLRDWTLPFACFWSIGTAIAWPIAIRAFREIGSWRILGVLFAFGAISFELGLFPYLAVGKVPTMGGAHTTGFAILVPLGAASMVTALLLACGKLAERLPFATARSFRLLAPGVAALALGAFAAVNARYYAWFMLDAFKQVAFVENIRRSPEARQGKTFFVEDKDQWTLNGLGRIVSLYEYGGLLKSVFGDETRYMITREWWNPDWTTEQNLAGIGAPLISRYNIGQYSPSPVDFRVIIRDRGLSDSFWRLLFLRFAAPERFPGEVAGLLSVELSPVPKR